MLGSFRHAAGAFAALAMLTAGSAFAQNGQGIEEKAKLCATCHGEQGTPINKQTPVIWGQNEGYLYLQLRDFKSGMRKNAIMNPIAEQLTGEGSRDERAQFEDAQAGERGVGHGP